MVATIFRPTSPTNQNPPKVKIFKFGVSHPIWTKFGLGANTSGQTKGKRIDLYIRFVGGKMKILRKRKSFDAERNQLESGSSPKQQERHVLSTDVENDDGRHGNERFRDKYDEKMNKS